MTGKRQALESRRRQAGILLSFALWAAISGLSAVEAKQAKPAPAKAPQNDPGCRTCLSQATSLFASGKTNDAADLLRQWSDRCPTYAQMHLLLSTILIRMGKAEEAAEAAARAVEGAPGSTGAHFQYALALMASGQNVKAKVEFEKVTEIDPANYEAWSTLSSLYAQLHDDTLAQQAAKKAGDLEPGTRTVRLRLLKNLQRAGKTREATAELKRLIDTGEFGPEFLQQLASEAITLKAYDEAVQASTQVAEAYPRSLAPLKTMAIAQLGKGDYQACLETAKKMTAVDPKSADAHSLSGMALVRMGRTDDADKEIAQALTIQPQLGMALAGAGVVQFARGNFSQASESLQQSLDADPGLALDAGLCFTLAQALEKDGENEFSLNYYKKSLTNGLSGADANTARQAVQRLEGGAR